MERLFDSFLFTATGDLASSSSSTRRPPSAAIDSHLADESIIGSLFSYAALIAELAPSTLETYRFSPGFPFEQTSSHSEL